MTASLPRHLLLDGGLATTLVDEFGLKDINDDPLWGSRLIKTDSELLKKAHTKFLEAGCDVIESITYQASIDGFKQHLGVSDSEARNMMQSGVNIACQARDEFWQQQQQQQQQQQHKGERVHVRPLVAASIGPYGACLCDGSEYTGSYVDDIMEEDLMSWHRKQVAALVGSDADLLAFDTVPAVKEAAAISRLLEEDFPEVTAWLSFSCQDEHCLRHGETFADAADSLLSSKQIVGVGINCTSPEHVTSLLESLSVRVKEEKLVLVYPNSGETWSKEKRWYSGTQRDSLASYVAEWLGAGACWIGGCCRITPQELRAAGREMLRFCQQHNSSSNST